MHTSRSDGRKTPEEALKLYKDEGYDFVALTDHWTVGEAGEFDGMLVLSGAEYDVYNGGCFHILGYGLSGDPGCTRDMLPQLIIDKIHDRGGLATLAHPAWSLTQPSAMAALHGVDCTEIYNSVSGYPYSARPYSGMIIDLACNLGFRATLTAADDTHYYGEDPFRGFVYVKAEALTRESILSAIKRGDCYGTQGPKIAFGLQDGEFVVRCEEGCRYVQFYSASYWQDDTTRTNTDMTCSCQPAPGGAVYEARFKFKDRDKFIRAEVCGFDGKFAYTQIFPAEPKK